MPAELRCEDKNRNWFKNIISVARGGFFWPLELFEKLMKLSLQKKESKGPIVPPERPKQLRSG